MTESRLFRARKRRGLKQGDVASSVGVTQGYYAKLESETSIPSPEIAAKLATFFGHEVTEMQLLFPSRYPTAVGA